MKKTFYAIAFVTLLGLGANAQTQQKVDVQTAPVSADEVKKREVVNADGTLSLDAGPSAEQRGRNNDAEAVPATEKAEPATAPAPAAKPQAPGSKKQTAQPKQAPK